MATKKRMNLVYGEKYGDPNDPKTRWTKVGSVFIDQEDGRISVKLDAVPVSRHFDGWLSVFEPRDDNAAQGDGQNAPAPADSKNSDAGTASDDDKPIDLSEIPF